MGTPLYDATEYTSLVQKATRSVARSYPDLWVQFGECAPEGGDLTSEAWLCLTELLASMPGDRPISLAQCFEGLADKGIEAPEAYLVAAIQNRLRRFLRREGRYEVLVEEVPAIYKIDASEDELAAMLFRGEEPDLDDEPATTERSNDPIDRNAIMLECCRDGVDRRIVELRGAGKAWKEICEIMQISRSGASRRLQSLSVRCKRRVQQELSQI